MRAKRPRVVANVLSSWWPARILHACPCGASISMRFYFISLFCLEVKRLEYCSSTSGLGKAGMLTGLAIHWEQIKGERWRLSSHLFLPSTLLPLVNQQFHWFYLSMFACMFQFFIIYVIICLYISSHFHFLLHLIMRMLGRACVSTNTYREKVSLSLLMHIYTRTQRLTRKKIIIVVVVINYQLS